MNLIFRLNDCFTAQLLLPAAEELEEYNLASDDQAPSGDVLHKTKKSPGPDQYSMRSSSALILQDVSSEQGSSCLDDAIPLSDMQVKDSPSEDNPKSKDQQQLEKLKLGQGNNSACSSSSGGAEIRSYLKDKDLPDLGPTVPNDKSLPADLNKVKSELAKMKSRGKDYDVLRHHHQPDYEGGAKAKPPRSLRKTKSRGKGKGSRHFSPIMLDNLAFDNQAYSSDSDHEGGENRQQKNTSHKECWS